ncbi:MAG TPA: host specificity factor TipJ family phage tail protein [Xanthobacteraceae bacterium]
MATIHIFTNMETAAPQQASRVFPRRMRLSTAARRSGLDPRREVLIAQRNGRWVRQRDWSQTLVGKNDVVKFVVIPGKGDTLRTVALLAVLVMAVVVAGPLGGSAWLAGAGLGLSATQAGALIIGGAMIAGSYAINALIPLPRPDAPGLSSFTDVNSPTYAFTASSQQNLPRLGGKIPEWFGYHRVIPDLAATAWWEWADGKQTLHQTLSLSNGEIEVDKIELGRTPIETFEEIGYALFGPNVTADLFEAEVYQANDVGGIELTAPNELVAPDDGVRGPFTGLPPGQTGAQFGLDIGFPRGLFLQGGGGALTGKTVQWRVEACEIDDAGAEVGSWFKVADETFNSTPGSGNTSTPEAGITGEFRGGGYATSNDLNSPLTVSYRYTLASSGRYQFRVTRLDSKDLTSLAGHDLAWSGLRGFLGDGDYGDVTILQIAITATASVNDRTVRQIAVTGTRKLPTWDAELEEWTAPVATRSIAWAVAHVIRGDNGGRQPDESFDLEALLALHATWEARGNYFDYYASSARPLWEMLQTILRVGRAVPYRQAHMIRFYRDAPQTMPAASFTRANIAQRSLKIMYRLPEPEDDADGIEVKYFDRRTWNFNTLRKSFVGAGVPARPIARALDGCIEVDRAQEELDYYVADYTLRPISASFDTEMDGMYPSYGSLVLMQHDSPRWGLSNRVLDWDAANLTVTLFSPPLWTFADGGWFARFRDIRGRPSAQVAIASAPTSTTIVLQEAPVYDDDTAFDFTLSDSELLHVTLGRSTDAPKLALFKEMTPGQGRKCSVKVVLEDPAVHVN